MSQPSNLKEWPEAYSNFDHTHPGEEAEAAVRAGTHYIEHPAWRHWGVIWFEGGQFIEEVMQHASVCGRVREDTLKDVFDAVNDQFGWD